MGTYGYKNQSTTQKRRHVAFLGVLGLGTFYNLLYYIDAAIDFKLAIVILVVWQGLWVPEGENIKIPVAIKVLQEGVTAGESRGMLEEARIMASVNHACCVHVLAVCLTAQMMLVTQLMPLGCLLEYVRKNQSNVGSKSLLNWCTQIARVG